MKLPRAALSSPRCKGSPEILPRRGAQLKAALPSAVGCPQPQAAPPAIPPEAASPPTVMGRRGNASCSGPPPVRGDRYCPTASLSSTYPCQLLRALDSKSLDNTQLSSLPSRYFSENSVVLTIQGKGYSKWSNVKIHIEL